MNGGRYRTTRATSVFALSESALSPEVHALSFAGQALALVGHALAFVGRALPDAPSF